MTGLAATIRRNTIRHLAAVAVLCLAASARAQQLPPARVAVVDMGEVLRQSEHMKDFTQALTARVERVQTQVDRLNKDISDLQLRISMAPRSDRRPALEREIMQLSGELEKARQTLAAGREQGVTSTAARVYAEVEAVVEKLAAERGYVLVLRINPDDGELLKPGVMYAGKRLDVTPTVVVRVNRLYAERKNNPND